jgi:hypothetical protein
MCNRIRGLKEWSEIPRSLTRSLINFEYNPNVAPTEQVPAFLAERGKPLATTRTDSLRRGSFKTMLANKRCVSAFVLGDLSGMVSFLQSRFVSV